MIRWKSFLLGGLMVVVSGLTYALRPTPMVADGTVLLEQMVPKTFGRWKEVPSSMIQMSLTPKDGETNTDMPYDQTLMRTYVRDDGAVVMLALAYGRIQRQEVKIHRPELCYVAQGFAVRNRQASSVDLGAGTVVPAYRLVTGNDSRTEPVTYWIRIGGTISQNAWQTRAEIFRDGLRGQIPDGILVRVSQALPRGAPLDASYRAQSEFLQDLYGTLDGAAKRVLTGPTAG